MKIIFMGTSDFAVYPLKRLIESKHDVVCVVSQPDSNRDRGKKLKPTPVKEVALKNEIPILQPEKIKNNEEFLNRLKEYKPDLIVVAAYGQILPKEILELADAGCVNIHGSILPRWRGAAPVQRAIMEQDKESGATLMYMAEGLDTGDIIAIKKVDIERDRKNSFELFFEISRLGGELLIEELDNILEKKVIAIKQNDDEATYANMISKKEGILDFSKSSNEIDAQIRGLFMWPGTYTYLNGELLKVWEAEPSQENFDKPFGTIVKVDKNGVQVCCGSGSIILKTVQLPNKRRMSVADYIKGNEIKIGSILKNI